MRLFILFLLMAIPGLMKAQEQTIIYLDQLYERTLDSEKIVYEAHIHTEDSYVHADVYKADFHSLHFTGSFEDASLMVRHGAFTFYYDSGNKESAGEYYKNSKVGCWKRWDWQGNEKPDRYYPQINDVEEVPVIATASFPGGEDEMLRFIRENLKYPATAVRQKIEGEVQISFTINKQGKISDIAVIKPLNYFMDHEAIRLVESMPVWQPATRNGVPIESVFILPVLFELPQNVTVNESTQ